MHPDLEDAVTSLDIADKVPSLRAAAADSERKIEECRSLLRAKLPDGDEHSDIVAFGSLARREFTDESDFDYLVVAHSLDPRPNGPRDLVAQADQLRWRLSADTGKGSNNPAAAPGGTQLFGGVISASDVTERIGLQADTNHDQTRRLLVLEESVSLLNSDKHEILVKSIIDRYLASYANGTKPGVPRFLLNDVIRYWRTLTVDYQAKASGTAAQSWGLRYLKLIVSRKLTYAGSLIPLLTSSRDAPADPDRLYRDFTTPPLARLARLHHYIAQEPAMQDALRTTLLIADEFIAKSGNGEWRKAVKGIRSLESASTVKEFAEMRDRAKILQESLQSLFFESNALGATSLRYLAF